MRGQKLLIRTRLRLHDVPVARHVRICGPRPSLAPYPPPYRSLCPAPSTPRSSCSLSTATLATRPRPTHPQMYSGRDDANGTLSLLLWWVCRALISNRDRCRSAAARANGYLPRTRRKRVAVPAATCAVPVSARKRVAWCAIRARRASTCAYSQHDAWLAASATWVSDPIGTCALPHDFRPFCGVHNAAGNSGELCSRSN